MDKVPKPLLFNENIPGRVEHLRRSAEAVLKKIQLVYGLTNDDIKLPDTVSQILPDDKEADWQQKWSLSCNEQADRCCIPDRENKIQQWAEKGKEIIARYQQGFHIRGCVLQCDAAQIETDRHHIYKLDSNRRALVTIYINHLANWAEAELMELGLNDISAHKLNGLLIRKSVEGTDSIHAYLRPKHSRKADPATEIATVRDYWRNKAVKLNAAYHAAESSR